MDIKELKEVGLTEGEIKVYSALLDLGETTRAKLAKRSGISPSKIYDVCNRLLEKGIISSVKKNGIFHFSAANPKRLEDFIQKKLKIVKNEEKLVNTLLPSLLMKYNELHEDTDIQVYHGWKGLKTVFLTLENSMTKKDVSFVFGASAGKHPDYADIFWKKHQARVEKRGYKVKIIFNEDMRKRKQRHEYYDDHKVHEIRYLHQSTPVESYIYSKYVLLFISLEKPIGILIKNLETVEAFKKFFETMWKQAKK